MRKIYLVIACSKCQRLLLARQGTKTRQCPYCGRRIGLSKAETLWMTSDIEEARSVLRSKSQSRPEKPAAEPYGKVASTHF
ncbi:DUF1922 domain-containing protein [Candidatus Bathyarchaeota archaeon]|nr:DUF1922 domain-containing protein [Candidatus Bathyarchaeota archaeon]